MSAQAERPLRVLAIDGGGIRGLIPAVVLEEIERRTGKPSADLFDLIAGTSTGGIIAATLVAPDQQGRPMWTAHDMVRLWESIGQRIFSRSLWSTVKSLDSLLDERYPIEGIEDVLEEACGDSMLSEAVTHMVVTSYEMVRREIRLFDSADAKAHPERDLLMKLAARATAAAPTYFEPAQIGPDHEGSHHVLVDGAVFANNPSMAAYTVARATYPEREVFLLSLGTGTQPSQVQSHEISRWGLAQWARPLLHMIMDGAGQHTDQMLQQLLGPDRYVRVQTELKKSSEHIDDSTSLNIDHLHDDATETIRRHDAALDQICAVLTT
jgi:patatin-like phospholipase/acyl hydrolase